MENVSFKNVGKGLDCQLEAELKRHRGEDLDLSNIADFQLEADPNRRCRKPSQIVNASSASYLKSFEDANESLAKRRWIERPFHQRQYSQDILDALNKVEPFEALKLAVADWCAELSAQQTPFLRLVLKQKYNSGEISFNQLKGRDRGDVYKLYMFICFTRFICDTNYTSYTHYTFPHTLHILQTLHTFHTLHVSHTYTLHLFT